MRKGEATREQIVKEAFSQALAIGLESVSLGKLADGLSLSKSGLFAHFKSKEALQLAVVQEAIDLFTKTVILPALTKPRGEPRVRALFDNWMKWVEERRGCIFMVLSTEFDDRPGPVRDLLLQAQSDWRAVIVRAVTLAIREGHFSGEVEPAQFAFEMKGITMASHELMKLFHDRHARERARRAFSALIERSRA